MAYKAEGPTTVGKVILVGLAGAWEPLVST